MRQQAHTFGVGSKGGIESVVRAVERDLDGPLDRPYTHLTSLDISNAFNTAERRDIAKGLPQYAPFLYRAGDVHTAALPASYSAPHIPSPRHRETDRVIRRDRSGSRSAYAH
jgi:hypothetical protein